jgi:hypothetical protein
MLSLDSAQADWLENVAAAAGVSPEDYLLGILDEARLRPQAAHEPRGSTDDPG